MTATTITIAVANEVKAVVNSSVSFAADQLQSIIDAACPSSLLVSTSKKNGIAICRRVRSEDKVLLLTANGLPAYEVVAKSSTRVEVRPIIMVGQYNGKTYWFAHGLSEVKELIIAEPCIHPLVSPDVELSTVRLSSVQINGETLTDVEFSGVFVVDPADQDSSLAVTVGYEGGSIYTE